MSKIPNPTALQLNQLSLREGLINSVDDIIDQVKVAHFDVHMGYQQVLEALRSVIPNPGYLTMDIPGTNQTLCEGDTYFSAGVFDGTLTSVQPWSLRDEASLEALKEDLARGRLLVDNAGKGTFTVLLTKDQIPDLKLKRDPLRFWNAMVAEFINGVIQDCVPWQTKNVVKKFSRFVDVEMNLEYPGAGPHGEILYKGYAEVLEEVLDKHLESLVNQVVAYVRKDTMAYMVATANNRGIQITNYGNALALIYVRDLERQALLDKQAQEE